MMMSLFHFYATAFAIYAQLVVGIQPEKFAHGEGGGGGQDDKQGLKLLRMLPEARQRELAKLLTAGMGEWTAERVAERGFASSAVFSAKKIQNAVAVASMEASYTPETENIVDGSSSILEKDSALEKLLTTLGEGGASWRSVTSQHDVSWRMNYRSVLGVKGVFMKQLRVNGFTKKSILRNSLLEECRHYGLYCPVENFPGLYSLDPGLHSIVDALWSCAEEGIRQAGRNTSSVANWLTQLKVELRHVLTGETGVGTGLPPAWQRGGSHSFLSRRRQGLEDRYVLADSIFFVLRNHMSFHGLLEGRIRGARRARKTTYMELIPGETIWNGDQLNTVEDRYVESEQEYYGPVELLVVQERSETENFTLDERWLEMESWLEERGLDVFVGGLTKWRLDSLDGSWAAADELWGGPKLSASGGYALGWAVKGKRKMREMMDQKEKEMIDTANSRRLATAKPVVAASLHEIYDDETLHVDEKHEAAAAAEHGEQSAWRRGVRSVQRGLLKMRRRPDPRRAEVVEAVSAEPVTLTAVPVAADSVDGSAGGGSTDAIVIATQVGAGFSTCSEHRSMAYVDSSELEDSFSMTAEQPLLRNSHLPIITPTDLHDAGSIDLPLPPAHTPGIDFPRAPTHTPVMHSSAPVPSAPPMPQAL